MGRAVNPVTGVGIEYRVIFDAVPGLYLLLDPDLNIITANSAYCRATMTEAGALCGRPLFEVFPDNPDDPRADGVRNLRASLARVLSSKKPDAMQIQQYDIRDANGKFETRHWSPLNTPVLGADGEVACIVHCVTDVSQVVRLQQAGASSSELAQSRLAVIDELRRALEENSRLLTSQRYLAEIVESSNDAIVARSLDGRIVSWNKAASQMFGYTPEEIIGKPADILAPSDRKDETERMFKTIQPDDRAVHFETVRMHKDGTPIPVALTLSPVLGAGGELHGTSVILRDITEQKRAEERLKNLQAELAHLSRWNTMGMMASSLAHELNQPLTASVNYVRAARRTIEAETALPPKAIEFLDKAVEETKLASGVIGSLRKFIDKREASRAPEDINKVVEEAISLSLAGGPDAKARLRVSMAPQLPPVLIDKVQIEQVLLNLIRNGLEATSEAAVKEISITTAPDESDFVRVSVADSGAGIVPEVAAKLFQPFVTSKANGMGVGLSICQSIIEAHGGRIWAENGPGAIFHFRLPTTNLA